MTRHSTYKLNTTHEQRVWPLGPAHRVSDYPMTAAPHVSCLPIPLQEITPCGCIRLRPPFAKQVDTRVDTRYRSQIRLLLQGCGNANCFLSLNTWHFPSLSFQPTIGAPFRPIAPPFRTGGPGYSKIGGEDPRRNFHPAKALRGSGNEQHWVASSRPRMAAGASRHFLRLRLFPVLTRRSARLALEEVAHVLDVAEAA